jgi:hypothetical protein
MISQKHYSCIIQISVSFLQPVMWHAFLVWSSVHMAATTTQGPYTVYDGPLLCVLWDFLQSHALMLYFSLHLVCPFITLYQLQDHVIPNEIGIWLRMVTWCKVSGNIHWTWLIVDLMCRDECQAWWIVGIMQVTYILVHGNYDYVWAKAILTSHWPPS